MTSFIRISVLGLEVVHELYKQQLYAQVHTRSYTVYPRCVYEYTDTYTVIYRDISTDTLYRTYTVIYRVLYRVLYTDLVVLHEL